MTTPQMPQSPLRTPRPLGNDQFATVTLDGSGNGIAQIGPSRVREHWQIQYVAVSVANFNATTSQDALAQLYLGSNPQASQLVSQSATGSSGDTCPMNNMDIQSGQRVMVKWTGGDPGQKATMVVVGTYTIGSPYGI